MDINDEQEDKVDVERGLTHAEATASALGLFAEAIKWCARRSGCLSTTYPFPGTHHTNLFEILGGTQNRHDH